MKTLGEVLTYSSARFPELRAYQTLSGDEADLTYAEVLSGARKIASFLGKNGVGARDKVCLYAPNGPEWALAFWGVVLSGAVAVPVDPNSGPAEIGHILGDTGARWAFASRKTAGGLSSFGLDGVVILDGPADGGRTAVHLRQVLDAPCDRDAVPNAAPESPAVIIYTSGTTMEPKGVVLSHRGILANLEGMLEVLDIDSRDRFFSVISLSHTFEITCGLVLPFMVGASVMYPRSLKYTRMFRGMQAFRPTVMLCVPAMFKMILERLVRRAAGAGGLSLAEVEKNDDVRKGLAGKARGILGGEVRFFVSGGAPLAPAIALGYRELGVPLLQVYGLTETSGVSTLTHPQDNSVGSAGKPLRNVDIRINDPGADGVGEVCIRGPHLMLGYHKNDNATRDVIRNGWLHSGDLGRLDETGRLFIAGRSKNVIVTAAGVNVFPEELEQRISKSPFIREICVIGKQRPDRTETVFASVVVNEEYLGRYLDQQKKKGLPQATVAHIIWEEIEACSSDLASFKRIIEVQIRHRSLPRGRTKKIIRDRVKRESFSIQGRLGKFSQHDDKETPIVFVNATAVTPFRVAPRACVVVEQGKISQLGGGDAVYLPPNARVIDLEGRYLLPGFIDLHIHGGMGFDFSAANRQEIETILDHSVSHGITHLLATVYPCEREEFLKCVRTLASLCRESPRHGLLHGIHLEGPFLSKGMSGALNGDYFWDATIDDMLLLQKAADGFLCLMTIAPELPGGQDVMQVAAQEGTALAIAHSEANYEDIEVAIDLGLSQVTHIFNAMAPMHHRKPGILTAALLKRELKAHLIADGFHVHPAVVDLLYRLKGPSGITLVSDATSACGCEDGKHEIAGKPVTVRQGRAYLDDGTLAGSTVTLDRSLEFMVTKTDVPLQEAVRMLTLNPARVLGLDHRKGILAVGKDADLVVMNETHCVEMTLIGGEVMYDARSL